MVELEVPYVVGAEYFVGLWVWLDILNNLGFYAYENQQFIAIKFTLYRYFLFN
jgi:hypothetical protein